MKFLTTFKLFEKANSDSLYRNTSLQWLLKFLHDGKALPYKGRKFISFSRNGSHDEFGDNEIEFNAAEVYKQGAITVEYNENFFETHPEISLYVTAFKNKKMYGTDDNLVIPWGVYISDFEDEQEVVIPKLTLIKPLIKKIVLQKETTPAAVKIIQTYGFPIEVKKF